MEHQSHKRQVFGYDVCSTASRSRHSFPSNWILRILIEIAKELTTRCVRSAIKDTAAFLGISMSDRELDLLADVG